MTFMSILLVDLLLILLIGEIKSQAVLPAADTSPGVPGVSVVTSLPASPVIPTASSLEQPLQGTSNPFSFCNAGTYLYGLTCMTCSQPSSGEYVTAVCSGIRDTVKLPCSVVIDGYRIVSPCNQGSSTGVGSDVVQSPCDAGSYCVAGVSTKCPGGSYSSTSGSLSCTPILDCSITLGYIGVNGQCTCDVGYMGTVEAGATTTAMTGCIQISTTTTTASISTTSSATSNEDEASAAALFSISGDGGLIGDRKLLNDILISVASPSRIASMSTSLHFITISLLLIYVILM